MDAIAKRGPGHARELAYIVPDVLMHPTAVFQGVREEGEQEWLCYCGLPNDAYEITTGRRIAPHLGEVFLVFVNADRVAYNWRWEKCDPDEIRLPGDWRDHEGINGRFDKRVL